jgi:predicted phosphate transport protein (TIGR00153 family)
MSWLTDFFRPRQDNFMKLLAEQADYAVKGLEALMTYATNGDVASADAVRRYEKDADEVRRILVDELNRTFVTPMDREDISALSRAIDDILDYAYSTVGEMQVLHVTPTPHLQRMVSLLCEAAGEVHLAMLRLKDHPSVATDHAQRAKALENRVESVYREAIAALFEGPADPEHIVVMLKLREIYRHLSNAADRGDEAANIISDVVVKMA